MRLIPQALNVSFQASGGYEGAFLVFVAFYAVLLAVTYFVYVRSGKLREHRV